MINDKLRKAKERTEALITASDLRQEEKDDLIDLLGTSLEGTNGLTEKEKLQNVSETNFGLLRLFCSHIVEHRNGSANSWRAVIVKCKRELMWLGFGIVALLMLHPQIAQIVEEILKK